MIETILLSFSFAVIGYTYSSTLTQAGHILNPLYNFIDENIKSDWIKKPLITCYVCVSGQIALWGYPILNYFMFHNYNVYYHLFSICLSITIAQTINKTLND